MTLTTKSIDTVQLPTGTSEFVVFDDEVTGFFVRVRAGGQPHIRLPIPYRRNGAGRKHLTP